MTIYEYANGLICIFEYWVKGQHVSFNFVPTLSLYAEHRMAYDYVDLYQSEMFKWKFDLYGNKVGGVTDHIKQSNSRIVDETVE